MRGDRADAGAGRIEEEGGAVSGAEIRRFSTDRRGLTLNVFLGIAGAALAALAETLVLPTVVLPYFVGQISDSYTVVGLVPAIGIGFWALARFPAALLVAPQRRKLPWAIGAALIRAAATALLAAVCFRAEEGAEDPLRNAFFICLIAYSLASGFASVPTAAVLAKAIPHDGRELFFRQRNIWGGLAGIVAGLVVAQLLSDAGPDFPRDYALLFLAATVCQTATAFFVATLREPLRVPGTRLPPVTTIVGGMGRALADGNFRRFFGFRLLFSLSTLADPFFVIFATSELVVAPSILGAYVIALVVGRLASMPLWSALARRYGEKSTLQVAALVRLVAPLLALLLPYVTGTDLYRERVDDNRVLAGLFGVAFLAIGASLAGQARGNYAYLAEVAPMRLRPSYVGLTNVALAAVAFAPIVGGLLVDRSGYRLLFLAATLIGLAAVFASGALTDTHVRTRPTSAAWRLRRATPAEP
jgi:MFS family permease